MFETYKNSNIRLHYNTKLNYFLLHLSFFFFGSTTKRYNVVVDLLAVLLDTLPRLAIH